MHETKRTDLTGWLADDYHEPLDLAAPAWEKKGEEIVGRRIGLDSRPSRDRYGNADQDHLRTSGRVGSKAESLLQYHRPLFEDGTIR